MLARLSIAALLFCTILSAQLRADDADWVVAGYLPNYRIAEWSGEVGPVTDVILFGYSVSPDGKFDASKISASHRAAVQEAKQKSGCRVLFCVGGWGKSSGFAKMSADPELRKEFVQQIAAYCQENGFDGVDYDWEHPEDAAQIKTLAQLLTETKNNFAEHGWLVTIAQASWQPLGKACYDAIDRVHLMSYDHGFPQATMEKSQIDVQRLMEDGCPAEKIALGMPFYGRNKERKTRTYSQLTERPTFSKDTSLVDGYAFNGPQMVQQKVAFAKEQGLAGVMIWELGQDASGELSLLGVIEDAVR